MVPNCVYIERESQVKTLGHKFNLETFYWLREDKIVYIYWCSEQSEGFPRFFLYCLFIYCLRVNTEACKVKINTSHWWGKLDFCLSVIWKEAETHRSRWTFAVRSRTRRLEANVPVLGSTLNSVEETTVTWAVRCKYEGVNPSAAAPLLRSMFAVIACSVRKSQTGPKNESVPSSTVCQNSDFLIKIWQNVGGWCCSSLGERSAFHWSGAFQGSHNRTRCLCSIIMHNWHLHACVNQSEHFLKLFFLFFSFCRAALPVI